MNHLEEISKISCWCLEKSYQLISQGTYQRQVSDYQYELYECKKCGTNRVYPVPNISLYIDGYQASTEGSTYVERDKPWCKDLAKEVALVLKNNKKIQHLKVLDVGCNGGELVEEIERLGIQSEGCDVDKVAIEFGKSKGRKIFIKDLAEEKLKDKYGVIMLNHTLEHIIPAVPFLSNIIDGIESGGFLVIHVPNYDSWISRLMKGSWGFLAPHEHVWNFTPNTLEALVMSAGGKKLEKVSINAQTSLETSDGHGFKIILKKVIIFFSRIFNRSDELVATFRKV